MRFLFALLPIVLLAQEYRATITGTIHDSSAAVIPNALVMLTNQSTNVVYRATSNEAGVYLIPNLQPATYTLLAEHPGFKRLERKGLVVQVGQRVVVDLRLEVGDTAESVTVTAEVPVLDTSDADLGTVIDQSYMDRQPVAIRNVMNMVSFAPGIVGGVGAYGTFAQKDFSVNGGGSGQGGNEVLVDGLSVVLPRGGGNLGNVPLTEAVQEFRVHATLFDAALGRSSAGAVSIVTRGGTNDLHGSYYYYWRPAKLRANTWTNNRQGQPLAVTDFRLTGGTVGGPVRVPKVYDGRNKTFFFVSLEKDEDIRSQTWQARVPTALERQGDFSQTLNAQGTPLTIYDPATTVVQGNTATRRPFPGNRIPANRINETGRAVLSLHPEPNVTGPARISLFNWLLPANVDVTEHNLGVRLDHALNDRHRLMGRYGKMRRQAAPRGVPRGMSSSPPTGGTALDTSDRKFHSLNLNYDSTLAPNTVLNVRSGFLRFSSLGVTGLAGESDPSEMKLPQTIVSNQAIKGWSTMSLGESMMTLGGSRSVSATDTFNTSASITRLRGTHTLGFGGEWRVGRFNNLSPGGSASGTFSFNNTFTRSDPFAPASGQTTGTSMAALLLGLPASGALGYVSALSLLNHYFAFYVKDDWKVTPRLTLNFGLRYELETPWKERYDRITYDFDTSAHVPVNVPGRAVIGGLRFVGQNGLSRYQGRTDRNNFGPRFGFALQATPKTVFRGGYGVFYAAGSVTSNFLGTVNSFNATTSYVASVDGGATSFTTIADPFPRGLQQPVGNSLGLATELGNAVSFFDGNRGLPYTQQWQFSIQRELPWQMRLQTAYVGMHSLKQFESFNLNEVPDPFRVLGTAENTRVPNPFFGVLPATSTVGASSTIVQRQLWLAYPQFTSVTINGANSGRSLYHGLQVSLEKRFQAGLSYMANYTWSKTIDNNTTSLVNTRRYRTVSSLDRSHVARFLVNYDLPFGPDRRFGNNAGSLFGRIIGGWSISGRITRESGAPLSISHPNGRPLRIADPRIDGSVKDRLGDRRDANGNILNPYFNVNAFAPLASQYDITPEPTVLHELRAPGSFNLDAVASKEVVIRERFRIGFRFEAYSATNSPIFSSPGTNMADRANFGVITSVGGSFAGRIVGVDGARVVQIAAEIKF